MSALRPLPPALGVVVAATIAFAPAESRAVSPALGSKGLAVLAEGEAREPAKSLARAVYADPGLVSMGLDEASARALVGEQVATDAPPAVRDLAETRRAIHGDDAPSRQLLGGLAASLHVKGIVVVSEEAASGAGQAARPVARVYVTETGAFDAARYEPDPPPLVTWGAGAAPLGWSGAVAALHRGFAPAPPPVLQAQGVPAPAAALHEAPAPAEKASPSGGRPFYTSPWFWGALGAAAFAGAAFFFASRDSSSPNIQLSVQVPK